MRFNKKKPSSTNQSSTNISVMSTKNRSILIGSVVGTLLIIILLFNYRISEKGDVQDVPPHFPIPSSRAITSQDLSKTSSVKEKKRDQILKDSLTDNAQATTSSNDHTHSNDSTHSNKHKHSNDKTDSNNINSTNKIKTPQTPTLPPLTKPWDVKTRGGLGGEIAQVKEYMKTRSFWDQDTTGEGLHYVKRDKSLSLTWETSGARVSGAVINIEGIGGGASLMSAEWILTGEGEGWSLYWEKENTAPVAGVIKVTEEREIFYYCEYQESGPPYSPSRCHFTFGGPPPEVQQHHQTSGAQPLLPAQPRFPL